jgi:hypothetical protein
MSKAFLYLILYVNYIWCSLLHTLYKIKKLPDHIPINNKELDEKCVEINDLKLQIYSKDQEIDKKNVEIAKFKDQNDSQTRLFNENMKRNQSFSDKHALMEEELASNRELIDKLKADLKEKDFEMENKIDQLEKFSCKYIKTLESIYFEKLYGDSNQKTIDKKEKNESKGEIERMRLKIAMGLEDKKCLEIEVEKRKKEKTELIQKYFLIKKLLRKRRLKSKSSKRVYLEISKLLKFK